LRKNRGKPDSGTTEAPTAGKAGALSTFRVREWSVRRKVVAVLAIPVALAAVFGGLRVSSELTAASDYRANQQRAGVLGPAITYLTATERLQMPYQISSHIDAADPSEEYFKAESALKKAAAAAGLSATEKQDVDGMIKIGDVLTSGEGTGITATPSVAISDMNRMTTDLINSTLNTQGTPDPKVQALSSRSTDASRWSSSSC
jgi:hypothetical protein